MIHYTDGTVGEPTGLMKLFQENARKPEEILGVSIGKMAELQREKEEIIKRLQAKAVEIKTSGAPVLTKSCTHFEVKALDEEKRTFTGLASTWDEDLGGDVIHKGAFKRTVNAWRAGKKALPLIDQHNYGSIRSVLGKMTDAKETDAGLLTSWEVIEGTDGDEALRRLKGGYIDSMSIGYQAVKWEYEQDPEKPEWERTRHLHEVKLFEVSLVIWGMNPGAVIDLSSVKSITDALKAGNLTPEQKQELRALLADPVPSADEPVDTPEAKGLAPDDPERIRLDELFWDIQLRSLATA